MQDVIELLLPKASDKERAHARKVATFLRVLATDARVERAQAVGLDLGRASLELDRQARERLSDALEDLLRHALHAVRSNDSCVWFGEPALEHQTAWSRVEEYRRELPELVSVPRPGELPTQVARRLIEALEENEAHPDRARLWAARLVVIDRGPAQAERSFLELCSSAAVGLRMEALEDAAACLLDRAHVRRALELLEGPEERTLLTPRLERLRSWCRLLLDLPVPAPHAYDRGPLPASLVDLREDRPALASRLYGKALREEPLGAATVEPRLESRSELGAVVFGVFRFEPGQAAGALFLDVASSLSSQRAAWLASRDGAWAGRGEPERDAVLTAAPVVLRGSAGAPPRGALSKGARALAIAPVLDDDGEVVGWLHIECEHQLVPSRARLVRLAAAWRESVLPRRSCVSAEVQRPEALRPEPSPTNVVFESLAGALGMKFAHRRWWGFTTVGGAWTPVASGGSGLQREFKGGGRSLRRASATLGALQFEEPNALLSVHAEAASGFVLPLVLRGRVVGLFACESEARRDFKRTRELAPIADAYALELRLAQFGEWHARTFGIPVCFDGHQPGFRAFAERFIAAARTNTPLVLCGQPGCGKSVLAHWAHFESDRADGELTHVTCSDAQVEAELLEPVHAGTLVLEGLEGLGPKGQSQLFARLAQPGESDQRLLITSTVELAGAASDGRLRSELALFLDRLQVRLPGLADRREELPALARCLLERFATEQGVQAPELDDTLFALLWRQRWKGNFRALENFVFKLVLHYAGMRVGLPEALELASAYGIELERRLPSRHPRREDLIAALATTSMPNGRLNKTRAALYLGWDPDTLVARMRDLSIEGEGIDPLRGASWLGPGPRRDEKGSCGDGSHP